MICAVNPSDPCWSIAFLVRPVRVFNLKVAATCHERQFQGLMRTGLQQDIAKEKNRKIQR
jgi:hypothetical protein